METVKWRLQSFSFSLTLGNQAKKSEKKLEESLETARDAAITTELHT